MAYQRQQDAIRNAQNWASINSQNSYYETLTDNYEVNTAYYQGNLNPDAKKYGTFNNKYQPKGISGHGALEKSKDKNGNIDKITFNTQTLSGQKQTVTQNIWKAEDGTKWYWDGTKNKYIQIK